jgi:CheY-like chemotaxis protein
MAIKYFYIDDDPKSENKVEGFTDAELSIDTMQHKDSWEEQLNFLKEKENDFGGLILDLKLDDLPNGNNKRADFRGTSLAQEIRTRQKERVLKPFPIVLFSANDKTQQALEKTGMDLFDIFIDKSKLDDKAFPIFTRQLIDLPKGYNALGDSSMAINELLKVDETVIDSRFVSEYIETKKSPVHIQSRFLITEFLTKQGILIDEDVLAARLGIDKSQSEDWKILLEKLSSTKYQGIYCNGWPRWWMHLVEQWWNKTIESDAFLRSTQAKVRVEKIKQVTHLEQLVEAEKIDKANSNDFWTVCQGYNLPLDPVDGLLVQGQDNLYPWQEPKYVSVDAALWRKNIDNWIGVADVEKEKYATLKTLYSRKRQ